MGVHCATLLSCMEKQEAVSVQQNDLSHSQHTRQNKEVPSLRAIMKPGSSRAAIGAKQPLCHVIGLQPRGSVIMSQPLFLQDQGGEKETKPEEDWDSWRSKSILSLMLQNTQEN